MEERFNESKCDCCQGELVVGNTLWCRAWHATCGKCLEDLVHNVVRHDLDVAYCPTWNCERELSARDIGPLLPEQVRPIWQYFTGLGVAQRTVRCVGCQALLVDNGDNIISCPFRACLLRRCRECGAISNDERLDHEDTCPLNCPGYLVYGEHRAQVPGDSVTLSDTGEPGSYASAVRIGVASPNRKTSGEAFRQNEPTEVERNTASTVEQTKKRKRKKSSKKKNSATLTPLQQDRRGSEKKHPKMSQDATLTGQEEIKSGGTSLTTKTKAICSMCGNFDVPRLCCARQHPLCQKCTSSLIKACDIEEWPRCPWENCSLEYAKGRIRRLLSYKKIRRDNEIGTQSRKRLENPDRGNEVTGESSSCRSMDMSDKSCASSEEIIDKVQCASSEETIDNVPCFTDDNDVPAAPVVLREGLSDTCSYCRKPMERTSSNVSPSKSNFNAHSGCRVLAWRGTRFGADSSFLPAHWDHFYTAMYKANMGFLAVPLLAINQEYHDVAAFYKLTSMYKIETIFRIQNPVTWKGFLMKRTELMKELGEEHLNEQMLFVGGTNIGLNKVCCKGFRLQETGQSDLFFSQACSAEFQSLLKESDSVIMASVLLGRSAIGQFEPMEPPPEYKSTQGFESCSNRRTEPNQFKVLGRHLACPTYRIYFK